MKGQRIIPFLKWPGGKRWFVSKHADLLPLKFHRYIEPFLGGGAVFFHLAPSKAILSDVNLDLICTYKTLRDYPAKLHTSLLRHQKQHCQDYYYKIRESKPKSHLAIASRFVYLNRTCFNGIYRVNKHGLFNVPMGTKTKVVLATDDFESLSTILASADIRQSDFESIINDAKGGDFIFADPPYTVCHNVNGFIKYNEVLFSWDDQVRLANALERARKRGAKILSTNANHHSIRQLYDARGFRTKTVVRNSLISAHSMSRKQFEEIVIGTD
jgi:DNA adenine methylase